MQRLSVGALVAWLAGGLLAQTVVLPANAIHEGSTSNHFPFGFRAALWPGLRVQAIYDSTNLTSQGVAGPITIWRIRWRTNGGNPPSVGTFATGTVALASAAVDYASASADFASNQGSDYRVCYEGKITVDPVPAGTPGGWFVTVNLTRPFTYDPTLGRDLIIDCDHDLSFAGVGTASHDVSGADSLSSRVVASSNYPLANGVSVDHGIVVELAYFQSAIGAWNDADCPGVLCGSLFPSRFVRGGVPLVSGRGTRLRLP